MRQPPVELVVFDVGGVLVDFGGVEAMAAMARIDDPEELWRRWLGCRWVRAFESGRCSADDFAAGVVADWSLEVTPAAFLESFRGWVGEPLAGAEALVREVARRRPVACLSNTNRDHWDGWLAQSPPLAPIERRFLSFELGMLKPDREVFEHVARSLAIPPARLLLLDDNTLNVQAALAAGFAARRTRGVGEARAALVEAGVLPPA